MVKSRENYSLSPISSGKDMFHRFWRLTWNRTLAVNLLVAIAYYVLAELSRRLASTPNDVTPVWPPDGIAVAAAMIYGKGVLPGIGLGSFLANFWAFWDPQSWATLLLSSLNVLGISVGTTLGTWLGTGLLKHSLKQRHSFGRVSSTIKFLLYAGLIGPIVNASFGVVMLVLQQTITWQDASTTWITWWISNVAGIVILSPLLLSWNDRFQLVISPHSSTPRPPKPYRPAQGNQASLPEAIALVSLLFVIAQASFWGEQSLAYMLVPLLIWAAFRLGQLGTTSVVLFTTTMAILGTVRGRGVFAEADLNSSLIALQSFIIVIAFTALILLAVLAERSTANRKLETAVQDLKAANNALADHTVKLGHAARLKDEFLAMVNHELRTPLIGILGMSEILNEGMLGSLNAEQLDAIQNVGSSGQHLLSLINDLLDLTSIETGQLKVLKSSVDINALCRASLDSVAPIAAQKQIQLTEDFPDSLGIIHADSKRLQQVFVNLLSNAIKFTPAGGQVHFIVTPSPATSRLRFSIKDTGVGLSESAMEEIFNRFFQVNNQLNRSQEGLGLGLAIAKQLVELHQGTIQVTSELGKGSCFTVELPHNLLEFPQPQCVKLLANQKSPYILIAEDDAVSRAVLTSYLKRHNYRLEIAHDGEEALAQAAREKPALVLMDIQMPVMDGLEAIRRLRQDPAFQDLPIIALTALTMDGDREKCLQAGATAYMNKPVQLKSLLSLIQSQTLTPTDS